jgi:2-aminobenzoate-CoA ligase
VTASAHVDTFARDLLPPRDEWPDFVFDLPALDWPARLNAASALIDAALMRGWGERTAIVWPDDAPVARTLRRWTYADLGIVASRIAHVLTGDFGVRPGNRVMLRGPDSPMTAACWFAIVKAGAIVVPVPTSWREHELTAAIDIAQISHALCDARFAADLDKAAATSSVLRHVARFATDSPDALETWMRQKTAAFEPVATAADDVAMIAFAASTGSRPRATMHFHRDILAACDCWPAHVLKASPDDLFAGSASLASTYGLGALLFFPLRIGASALLLESTTAEALLAAVARWRPSVLFADAARYRTMAAWLGGNDRARLAKCVSAGPTLSAESRATWKAATGLEIIDGIGATEMLHFFVSHREDETRAGAAGRSVPGYRTAVMDDAGRPLPVGVPGRLAVKGPTGCRYLGDARQRAYVRDGWNYPGDTGFVDADGYFVPHALAGDVREDRAVA